MSENSPRNDNSNVNIEVGKKYYITTDATKTGVSPMNFVVKKKKNVSKQDGSKSQEWFDLGYYANVTRCCDKILKDHTRTSHAETLRELIDNAKEMEELLSSSLEVNGVTL